MKDTIITARRKKIELITIICCFVVAIALNIYAIIAYDGKWIELLTTIPYIICFSIAIYAVWSIIRILLYIIKSLTKIKNNY